VSFASKRSRKLRSSPKRARLRATSHTPWRILDKVSKASRVRSLQVLRDLRGGQSLTRSSKYNNIDVRLAKRNLKPFIYKYRHRWKARKHDSIERGIKFYEKGRIITIIVYDEDASKAGTYFNDTKRVLSPSGNPDLLKRWKATVITDVYGVEHQPETRLNMLKELKLKQEDFDYNENFYDQ